MLLLSPNSTPRDVLATAAWNVHLRRGTCIGLQYALLLAPGVSATDTHSLNLSSSTSILAAQSTGILAWRAFESREHTRTSRGFR